jgi:hypothetical protein
VRVREVLLLELDAASGEELSDRGNEPARYLGDLDALEGSRPICVAEVRVQRRAPVRLDEHGRVRAREAGEVADVGLATEDVRRPGDEQRLVEERSQSLDPTHGRLSTRNSSASR